MSRATIESALTGLIPTWNGALPSELVDLAMSLLTRSRSVAHSLKSDEEIARPYACAELACERLKKRLNLPSIASRPPCPPRIYKKLYKYLEMALPAPTTAREPETPRKRKAVIAESTQTTPKTPVSVRKTPRSGRKQDDSAGDPPEWTMPTIRTLAKELSYPSVAPHVYTGVESILPLLARMSAAAAETPSKRPRRSATTTTQSAVLSIPDSRSLALIAVIMFYVLSKLMDQDITPKQYADWTEKAVTTLLKSPAGKDITEENLMTEIEMLMPMAKGEGWLQMQWFLNVAHPEDIFEADGIETTHEQRLDTGISRALKHRGSDYIGLGTMMQDATDYLGERRREDFTTWKAGILARVESIEAS